MPLYNVRYVILDNRNVLLLLTINTIHIELREYQSFIVLNQQVNIVLDQTFIFHLV